MQNAVNGLPTHVCHPVPSTETTVTFLNGYNQNDFWKAPEIYDMLLKWMQVETESSKCKGPKWPRTEGLSWLYRREGRWVVPRILRRCLSLDSRAAVAPVPSGVPSHCLSSHLWAPGCSHCLRPHQSHGCHQNPCAGNTGLLPAFDSDKLLEARPVGLQCPCDLSES